MRNLYIGLGLAAVLIAGLFAVWYFRERPADPAADANAGMSSAQVAAQIKPDFVGDRRVGSWRLSCGKGIELPGREPAARRNPGNSENAPPGSEVVPPHWKIPRCRAFLGLTNPQAPNEEIRITVRELGFKRALAVFLRFPPEEVNSSDIATLRIDQTEKPMPFRSCARAFCLSAESIRRSDEPSLMNAKTMTLKFTSKVAKKGIAIPIPTDGLGDAITAIRRIDK